MTFRYFYDKDDLVACKFCDRLKGSTQIVNIEGYPTGACMKCVFTHRGCAGCAEWLHKNKAVHVIKERKVQYFCTDCAPAYDFKRGEWDETRS